MVIQGQKLKQLKPCWNFKEVEPISRPGCSTPNFKLNIFLLGFLLRSLFYFFTPIILSLDLIYLTLQTIPWTIINHFHWFHLYLSHADLYHSHQFHLCFTFVSLLFHFGFTFFCDVPSHSMHSHTQLCTAVRSLTL